jgi:hypothetical protein
LPYALEQVSKFNRVTNRTTYRSDSAKHARGAGRVPHVMKPVFQVPRQRPARALTSATPEREKLQVGSSAAFRISFYRFFPVRRFG